MKRPLTLSLSVLVGIAIVVLGNKSLPHKKSQPNQTITSHFSIEKAPSNSLGGEIASFSGKVSWQSRVATEPAMVTVPRKLTQGENVVTADTGNATLQFANNCTLSLLPNTKLEVIQTLPVNMVFAQDSGNITYKKVGTTPLSVSSLGVLADQKNGTMTITVDAEQQTLHIQVIEGSVTAAFEDTDTTTQLIKIAAGQSYLYDAQAKEGSIE